MYSLYTPIRNLNNWFQDVGPQLPRHSVNLSGILDRPAGFEVSLISAFSSRAAFQPVITGADLYGTGTDQFLLPDSGTNRFNFGLGRSDLERLANEYNQTYGGRPTAKPGQLFPVITLPRNFGLGRVFDSQDLRITKLIRIGERVEWRMFGEVYNALNFANVTGYGTNLLDPGFGQLSGHVGSAFGSGGTRALQIGARLSF